MTEVTGVKQAEVEAVCERCGGADEVVDGLCGDCDDRVYCTVCEERFSRDMAFCHCHLHYDDGEWVGVGGEDMSDAYLEDFKQSLFAVLEKTGLAKVIRHTITTGRWTGYETLHFYGPMLGPMSVWFWLYDPETGGGGDYGSRLTDGDLSKEQEEAMAYGVAWLLGLDDRTPDAKRQTVEWIEQWLKPKKVKNG